MQRVTIYAMQGNTRIVTGGVSSTTLAEGSFPGCTVSVFTTGTSNLATIFGDNLNPPTPKSNPFTADSTGAGFFYAANGTRVDIQLSGTGVATPFVLAGDVLLDDFSLTTISPPSTVAFSATSQFDLSLADWFKITLTGNVTAPTFPNANSGAVLILSIIQDAVGGRTWTWPGSFTNPPVIASAANARTELTFKFDGTNWTMLAATGDNLQVPGGAVIAGNVTEIAGQNQYKSYSFNAILWVDGIKYTTVMAAYADLPSTGGVVMVPPNYSENVAADWTLSKAYSVIVFTGPASLVFGAHIITVPVGVHGVAVESWVPWGSAVTVAATGVEFNYTGTGTFWTVGASSADTYSFRAKDICIFTNNAGSAAVGIRINRCPNHELHCLRFIGPGGAVTQQAIILDGTGNFTGGILYSPNITGYFKGIQFAGSGAQAANTNELIGGSVSAPASGTSLGLDFQANSAGNVIYGTDIEGHAVGYNLAGTAQGNVIFGRSETNTSAVTLGSGTLQNEIHIIDSVDPFTDSGTGNLVFTSGGTMHGAKLQGASSLNAVTLLNSQDAAAALTGDGTDKTFYTFTLPAATLAAGKGVRVSVFWIHGTGTASITYKLFFGATAVINSASAVTGNGCLEAIVMNAPGTLVSQRSSGKFTPTGTASVVFSGNAPTENTANAVVIKATFNVANTDQITPAQWLVELIQ